MDGKTTHILLLRHGQTDANASGTLQGHMPTPLNRTGLEQANLLAARLAAFSPPVGVIVSSDLPRATQTAGPIASACGLPVVTDPVWRERGFGLLEGKPVGSREMWRVASGEIDPPGAEPTAEFHARVHTALLQLPEKYREKDVIAVVTHGGVIRGILRMLDDGRLDVARGPRPMDVPTIANASILRLLVRRYRDGILWRIAAVNDVAHLGELVSDRDNG
jgi:probable phosphoglycerate mutase